MKRCYLVLAAILVASPASAETIKNNLPVCVSEELLGQMTTAISSHDQQGFDYLLQHGCFPLKTGTRVSVLEHGMNLHIRAYAGDETQEAWTYIETVFPDRQP
jgi:hypothetical protein